MAEMLGGLIRANIEKSPVKAAIFRAIHGVVGIHIEDIEVSITLEFLGGTLVIHEGIAKPPDITIRTESGTVMDLSTVSIRFGLPYFFDENGRKILENVRNGRIRMSAMPWRLLDLIRLTRVMSIQD